ncbi:MAG: M3 family metallopeptidase [Hyphomicrobiaceae bacterium]
MPASANPLLADWSAPHEMPPFAEIKVDHFPVAFDTALAEDRADIDAIAANPDAPTFANTIDELERAGPALERVASVFFNLASADTNDAIQAIERDMAPRLARHSSETVLNTALFARIRTLYDRCDTLGLTTEQNRVLERYYKNFLRAGAGLDEAGKKRMAETSERLAALTTQFTQNVLADESSFHLPLETEDDLEGLPPFLRAAAQKNAQDLELDASHVITLARSSIDPFLQFSDRRDLRERAFAGWTARGANGGESDNLAIIREIVQFRRERAQLVGSATFAEYKLDDSMAKTPAAVEDLLTTVWGPARRRALEERDALQAVASAEGHNFSIAPWDWRYYAEKVRKEKYDLDETTLKPYFQLDQMIAAAFQSATNLFGLTFKELDGIAMYHDDVRVWEVRDAKGKHIGLFCGDYFARPSKRSGAWMTAFRRQKNLDKPVTPIIVNVMNFVKAADGEPDLLSYDDATTLFHEFGHALHGLLSKVTYPSVAGTSVSRDFVELPSQLFEHWLMTDEIIGTYATHAETGETIPEDLRKKLKAAENFNQGFATVEYLASAILDMHLHQMEIPDGFNVESFEAATLADIGMPPEITARHRLPHFLHLFAGDGYAAGYYSYLWSEVMDADAFRAFEETGNVFDPATAQKLHDFIYSTGGSRDPEELYAAFRGRGPEIQALLEGRGLSEPAGTS